MSNKNLYKLTFLNHGKVYELYCQSVVSSNLWGFLEVSKLVFEDGDGLVVDPTEEKLRQEFDLTEVLHLPIQSVLKVEEVRKRGQAVIRDRKSGEKVTPFPITPGSRKKS